MVRGLKTPLQTKQDLCEILNATYMSNGFWGAIRPIVGGLAMLAFTKLHGVLWEDDRRI
jgi:hypothetical protein